MSEDQKDASFETAMTQLEALVQSMESGQLTLEQSLQAFEQGIGLIRSCQKNLTEAKQKVQVLVENSGMTELKPFFEEADDV